MNAKRKLLKRLRSKRTSMRELSISILEERDTDINVYDQPYLFVFLGEAILRQCNAQKIRSSHVQNGRLRRGVGRQKRTAAT